ncbi:MAG: hypothetical protein LC644_10250 [Pseudonocardia sp.]|nr:hypothetical protein [Pseudonocardia sp.]
MRTTAENPPARRYPVRPFTVRMHPGAGVARIDRPPAGWEHDGTLRTPEPGK